MAFRAQNYCVYPYCFIFYTSLLFAGRAHGNTFLYLDYFCVTSPHLLFFFVLLGCVVIADSYFIGKAVKQLNEQCDPHPLLETVEQQLARVQSKAYRQSLQINKAAALSNLGWFDEAFSILSGINIDQYNGTRPITKIVYYNNMASAFINKGDYSQADICYSKMIQMMYSFKANEEQKKQLSWMSTLIRAELLIGGNHFAEAENLLCELSESMPIKDRIAKYMSYAKLMIKQNRPEEARPFLHYVIAYGNKLYAVVRAQEMLSRLNDIKK